MHVSAPYRCSWLSSWRHTSLWRHSIDARVCSLPLFVAIVVTSYLIARVCFLQLFALVVVTSYFVAEANTDSRGCIKVCEQRYRACLKRPLHRSGGRTNVGVMCSRRRDACVRGCLRDRDKSRKVKYSKDRKCPRIQQRPIDSDDLDDLDEWDDRGVPVGH